MATTFITSVASLFAISLFGFFIVFTIFSRDNKDREDISFANCWAVVGIIFFLMGIRSSFFALDFPSFDKALAFVVQAVIIFAFFALGYYSILVTISRRAIKNSLYFIIFLLSVTFLVFLGKDGIQGPLISDWGTEYTAPLASNIALVAASGLAVLILIYGLIKNFFSKKKNISRILSMTSILLLLIFGALEQLGNTGWQVLFMRILILLSGMVGYFGYEMKKEREDQN